MVSTKTNLKHHEVFCSWRLLFWSHVVGDVQLSELRLHSNARGIPLHRCIAVVVPESTLEYQNLVHSLSQPPACLLRLVGMTRPTGGSDGHLCRPASQLPDGCANGLEQTHGESRRNLNEMPGADTANC
eukprot:501833-Amphidinium_carterae.1